MLTAALLAVALGAPAVSPAEAAQAEQLVRLSMLEYNQGHAADALRDIERAYRLDPLPGMLFNLGQCHRALQHWEEAETAYRNYLRYRPDAPNRETVLKLMVEVHYLKEEAKRHPDASRPAPKPTAIPEERVSQPSPLPPPVEAEPAPKPAEAPSPTWADERHAPAKSTAWPWVFGATAAVAAGFSIAGWVQVGNYYSLRSASSPSAPTPLPAALGAASSYGWGEPLGVVGAVLTVAGVGGLIWTW